MQNFREIAERFLETGAAVQVSSGEELGRAWIELISDTERRARLGRAAREIVERNRGATERSLERIAAILEPQRSRT
jgi:3-deoxy-D-manno-octulosonic-acid transferase